MVTLSRGVQFEMFDAALEHSRSCHEDNTEKQRAEGAIPSQQIPTEPQWTRRTLKQHEDLKHLHANGRDYTLNSVYMYTIRHIRSSGQSCRWEIAKSSSLSLGQTYNKWEAHSKKIPINTNYLDSLLLGIQWHSSTGYANWNEILRCQV